MTMMNDDDTIGENIEACEARQWKNGDSDAIWIMAPSHRTTTWDDDDGDDHDHDHGDDDTNVDNQ